MAFLIVTFILLLFAGVPVNCKTAIPLDEFVTRIHGGWSVWSEVTCTRGCGGGVGIRVRRCDNPIPSLYGEHCSGPSSMRFHCNMHNCGQPSFAEAWNISKQINTRKMDIVKDIRTGSVIIDCEGRTLFNTSAFPNATIVWMKDLTEFTYNNTHLSLYESLEPFRSVAKVLAGLGLLTFNEPPRTNGEVVNGVQVLENGSLYLSGENKLQSGLWLCAIRTKENLTTILSVVPVVFTPTAADSERYTLKDVVYLSCNAYPLSVITYKQNLTQVWYHNHSVYGIIQQVNTMKNDILTISNIKREHAGSWMCNIQNEDTKLIYPTAHYQITVHDTTHDIFWDGSWNSMIWPLAEGEEFDFYIDMFVLGVSSFFMMASLILFALANCGEVLMEWYVNHFEEE